MRVSVAASCVATLLLAIAGMSYDARSESVSVDGIVLESAYGAFKRGEITNNETRNPGYGFTIAYHANNSEATVYVYTRNRRDIPDGPTSHVVMEEFNQATRDVLSLAQRTGRKIELIDRYGTGSPERGREFLCSEFIMTEDGGLRRTFLYMTGASHRFVKIRVSLRTNDATDPTARNFADAVASQLWKK